MQVFLFKLSNKKEKENQEQIHTNEFFIDIISNLYKNWSNVKKMSMKLDQDFIFSLKKIGIEITNGHLYLSTKNKHKKCISPY